MSLYLLSLGSNIRPEKHIPQCIQALKKALNVERVSSIYETDPVGPTGPHVFWNMGIGIQSDLSRENLTKVLRKIEDALGRTRDAQNKFAPRTIDIDILPQQDYQRQAFIMIPIAEIYPEEKDPETNKTFRELAKELETQVQACRKVNLQIK